MSHHAVSGEHTGRIRIKGHWQSVLRFFFIAVSKLPVPVYSTLLLPAARYAYCPFCALQVGFMMTWVLITSELGYYSK